MLNWDVGQAYIQLIKAWYLMVIKALLEDKVIVVSSKNIYAVCTKNHWP